MRRKAGRTAWTIVSAQHQSTPRLANFSIRSNSLEKSTGGRILAIISGTNENDALTGTDGDDRILGGGGNDVIDGLIGQDELYGESGNDRFRFTQFEYPDGRTTSDYRGIIDGGDGYDTIEFSTTGRVNVFASGDSSYVRVGGRSYDFFSVEEIRFVDTAGDVFLNSAHLEPLKIIGWGGADTFIVNGSHSTYGMDGNDHFIIGAVFNNSTGSYEETFGLADGGDGIDTIYVPGAVTIDLDAGFADATVGGSGAANDIKIHFDLANFENIEVFASNGAINDFTSHYQSTAVGNAGDNDIRVFVDEARENDIGVEFYGKHGNDILTGSNGMDRLHGGADDDVLYGAGGDDELIGGSGNDRLDGGTGVNHLAGGLGNDLYQVDDEGDQVFENVDEGIDTVNVTMDRYTLGDHVENLDGTSSQIDQSLFGNNLDNVIDGGRGKDRLAGGLGDDIYFVDQAGDKVIETAGEGHDTVFSSASTYRLRANLEDISLLDGGSKAAGNDLENVIRGNDQANSLNGRAGDDILHGGGGNDVLIGGAGADELYGDAGDDQLDGGSGADILAGGLGDDVYIIRDQQDSIVEDAGGGQDLVRTYDSYALPDWVEDMYMFNAAIEGTGNARNNHIFGNAASNTIMGLLGDDVLDGGAGTDSIDGGEGNDRIIGGIGEDILTGGAGADEFRFKDGDLRVKGSRIETIMDFNGDEGDVLDFRTMDADSTSDGHQDFAFVGTDAFSGHAGELRYEQAGGDTFLYGDTDGDGVADFQMMLVGQHDLRQADFVL